MRKRGERGGKDDDNINSADRKVKEPRPSKNLEDSTERNKKNRSKQKRVDSPAFLTCSDASFTALKRIGAKTTSHFSFKSLSECNFMAVMHSICFVRSSSLDLTLLLRALLVVHARLRMSSTSESGIVPFAIVTSFLTKS